jgi:hypothetical protein
LQQAPSLKEKPTGNDSNAASIGKVEYVAVFGGGAALATNAVLASDRTEQQPRSAPGRNHSDRGAGDARANDCTAA